MPGKGKGVMRDYTPQEREAIAMTGRIAERYFLQVQLCEFRGRQREYLIAAVALAAKENVRERHEWTDVVILAVSFVVSGYIII